MKPTEITDWLTAAFLADIRESHPRMAGPDRHSQCSCPTRNQVRHWHNWVLLVDGIDHPGGATFITDLLAARERHLRQHPGEHDALLVVATSGRWDSHWESRWQAPWQPPLENIGRARAVPRCQDASYEHWAGQASDAPRVLYYPVLLEPLTIEETARILGINQRAPECVLAQRATGGLPVAVHLLKGLLRDRQFRSGARDVLEPVDPAHPGADPWRERLAGLRLAQRLPDVGIDEFVTAAPFATAPWLLPHDATSLIMRPHVGRILTELRIALWITASTRRGVTPNDAELHPWIARTLVSALARNGTSYREQFEALLDDPDTSGDPTRTAYCQLALGRIGEVVDAFAASFDHGPHQEWIDRLELVTGAPDNQPLDRSCAELYEELVTTTIDKTSRDRSAVGNIITRLVTARWLAANPFAVPDPTQRDIIQHAYGEELPPLSRRPDVAALYEAARRDADPLSRNSTDLTMSHGGLTGLRRQMRGGDSPGFVIVPNFFQRRRIISSLVVILVIGSGCLAWWSQSQKCGRGMTAIGSPYVCVGLDLDSTALQNADPLADLEHTIAENNRAISEPFATIVVLQDLTPDPRSDSVALRSQRHAVEGAITAVSRANDPKVSGAIPKIKLLLANYGFQAGSWRPAVDAIKQARLSEHIVAVTGVGQSRDTTRAAVASLSDAGVAVVGGDVTADNMNVAPSPGGKRSTNFFRVAPTNTDEARAAARYITQHSYHKVLLVKDVNEGDSYVQTLGNAFAANVKADSTERYRSPNEPLQTATREQLMVRIFAQMHSDICAFKPDLIYFAGRGTDLEYFLTAMSSSGACGLGPLDVMTGDDAENLVGGRISTSGDVSFTVFYTAFAHTGEWNGFPPGSDYVKNYQDFAAALTGEHFKDANLDDGEAMVHYDAVQVVVSATHNDPLATTEPETVANFLVGTRCHNTVAGASGPIAFDPDGNPIDKAMPILQINADGSVTQKDLAWPTGQPLDPTSTC